MPYCSNTLHTRGGEGGLGAQDQSKLEVVTVSCGRFSLPHRSYPQTLQTTGGKGREFLGVATGLDTVGFRHVVVAVSPTSSPDEAFTALYARVEEPASDQGFAHPSHSGRRTICTQQGETHRHCKSMLAKLLSNSLAQSV